MNIFALSGLLIAITSGVEALLMFSKGKRKFHYLWGIFCLSVLVWGLGGYMIAISMDPTKAALWWRIAYVGVIFIPIFLLHFIYEFLEIARKKTIIIFYALGVIFLSLNLASNLFINKVRFVFDQFYYISPPAPFYTPFVLMFIGLVVYSLLKLWQAYRSARGIRKSQLKYIFVALAVGFSGGSFSFLPVYKIDFYPFLNLTVSLGIAIVAYAILRYRLMDIRIVARKFFIYFSVATFTYVMFYLITWIYNQVFGSVHAPVAYFAGIFISFIFVLGFYSFDKLLLIIANRYFFVSLYNYQETINRLSQELNHYNDLNKIISLIIETIKKTMQLNRAGVLLINQNKNPVHYQIANVIGFNEQNGISLVQDNFLTRYLHKTQKPLVRDELLFLVRDAGNKQEKDSFKRLHDHMEHIEASLCLPLISSGKLIGIIVLGAKISNDAYTKEDLELLNTLTNQAGTAIDNARLYKEVQDFNKTLKGKVNEQTKDIKQKSKYLQELLDMKTDFLRVVNHQLNTPLSVMKGYFSMMKEGSYPTHKAMPAIEGGLERISSTVADFWDAYELEGEKMKMEPQKTDITEIVDRLIPEKQKLPLAQERKLQVIVQKPGFKIPLVWCDYKKIAHAISNILDNAIYYTRQGSVMVYYELLDDNLKINVKDTGVGISKEDKKKIFQKFSRGDNATDLRPDGSGLGLFIAKKIVEGNDGKMTYFSEGKDKGSTFSFAVPIYKNQKIAPGEEKPVTRGKKIVIFGEK